jgi:hypothetical protein
MSWSRRFDSPIVLPDGRELATLVRHAITWLSRNFPKTEHNAPRIQLAAQLSGTMMMADIPTKRVVAKRNGTAR